MKKIITIFMILFLRMISVSADPYLYTENDQGGWFEFPSDISKGEGDIKLHNGVEEDDYILYYQWIEIKKEDSAALKKLSAKFNVLYDKSEENLNILDTLYNKQDLTIDNLSKLNIDYNATYTADYSCCSDPNSACTSGFNNISVSFNRDGTFILAYGTESQYGYVGYYTIQNNKILLNSLLQTGVFLDVSVIIDDKIFELEVNDGKLLINDEKVISSLLMFDESSVTLSKNACLLLFNSYSGTEKLSKTYSDEIGQTLLLYGDEYNKIMPDYDAAKWIKADGMHFKGDFSNYADNKDYIFYVKIVSKNDENAEGNIGYILTEVKGTKSETVKDETVESPKTGISTYSLSIIGGLVLIGGTYYYLKRKNLIKKI